MSLLPNCRWSFATTELPVEAYPPFKLLINTLRSDKAGEAYIDGRLEKPDTHARMQQLLVERLTLAEEAPDTIKSAVAMLDHIQHRGHEWGWFKKPAKTRTAYSNCDESWLWDKSRANDRQEQKVSAGRRPQRSHAQRIEDFETIEKGIRKFLKLPDPEPLALLGCLEAVLITRCAVISRATLNATMVALRTPVLAAQGWWYLDVTHRSGKKRLELRRVFLDPVTGSLAIRWHAQIAPVLDGLDTSERQQGMAEKAFRAFARAAGLPREMRTTDAMQSAAAWLAVTLPGFLMAVTTRKRVTHSLPNAALRRALGLRPIVGDLELPHSPPVELEELSPTVADVAAVKGLLDLIGSASPVPFSPTGEQLERLTLPEQVLADWLISRQMSRHNARRGVLLIGHSVAGAMADRRTPLSVEDLASIRAFLTEDIERTELLDLADAFVDWLSTSAWAAPPSSDEDDEDRPGVSANILSPREQRLLLEHLASPACGVADAQLRDILRVIVDLGCVGMRRAEALKLRVRDWKPGPAPSGYPLLSIEPYKGRGLKSISSRRYAPGRLLNPELRQALVQAHERPRDDMLILPYQLTTHTDQTIWLTANRTLQAFLQDASLHLHHCRHTAATLLLIQLMAAPLGIHRYKGRCGFLDSLLEGAEEVADALTLKNPCSLQHLRAISLLLGHLSPLITLKSYIHSCDLLLLFALDRSGEPGYSQLLALASGRPVETVKHHQTLAMEAREHLARQTLLTPNQRTHDGYTLLRLVEHDYPGAVSRDDTPIAHDKSDAGEGPSFVNIAELMAHVAQRATPDEQATVRELITQKKESGPVAAEVPTLRRGLMTSTATDWAERLHRAFNRLPPGEDAAWKTGLTMLLQEIDAHRSLIRIRKGPGTEVIVDVLRQMDFKVRDWQVRPPQEKGGAVQDFRFYRTWRDALAAGRPLQLRPAPTAEGFSYEGARWAVLGHLLYLNLRL
ncbi:MAG: hypothetical protein K0Q68_2348 [Moraxellaceae bacterium]|jgi:hypothetical protein|nr:hypothetical protein [Moraxellaceae bacterium]